MERAGPFWFVLIIAVIKRRREKRFTWRCSASFLRMSSRAPGAALTAFRSLIRDGCSSRRNNRLAKRSKNKEDRTFKCRGPVLFIFGPLKRSLLPFPVGYVNKFSPQIGRAHV